MKSLRSALCAHIWDAGTCNIPMHKKAVCTHENCVVAVSLVTIWVTVHTTSVGGQTQT